MNEFSDQAIQVFWQQASEYIFATFIEDIIFMKLLLENVSLKCGMWKYLVVGFASLN